MRSNALGLGMLPKMRDEPFSPSTPLYVAKRFQRLPQAVTVLFRASAETMLTIAADPKHLGARIAITAVLHTWGSAMTHHPHVHMIVPGGGLSPACPGEPAGGKRWIATKPNFFLPCWCSPGCSGA